MFRDQGDVPRVRFRNRVLPASQADQAGNLASKVAQSAEDLIGIIAIVQGEQDDMSKHVGEPFVSDEVSVVNPRLMTTAADRDVEIVEVAPRDGLQNDPALLSTDQKVELINRCVGAGIRRIEVASFVNPKRVPQMADAEAVLAALPSSERRPGHRRVMDRAGAQRARIRARPSDEG